LVKLACVSGRFQPLHRQHVELFERALQEAEQLIVAITNPDQGALYQSTASTHRHRLQDNPFTYFERSRFVAAVLRERGWLERATIVPFDLGAPAYWASYVPLTALQLVRVYSPWEEAKVDLLKNAGYAVRVLAGDAAHRVNGGTIRTLIRAGGDWEPDVPDAVVPLVRAWRQRVLDVVPAPEQSR
jgi:cytidyltransferase-like protein